MKHFCSFSEAIREGAKLRPQAFDDPDEKTRNGNSCAIEAGLEAIRGRYRRADSDSVYNFITLLFPYLDNRTKCPASECGGGRFAYIGSLRMLIWHLNDTHKWTREAIADWLESEEEKLGFVTVVEPECAVESAKQAHEIEI